MARPTRLLLACLAALAAGGCFRGTPCPSPLEQCGDVCFDLRSDPDHCGRCGVQCAAGLACVDGECGVVRGDACAERTGGAFVTLAFPACGETVKLWSVAEAFNTRAEVLLADPSAPGASIPRFDLRGAPDCDGQWSWHTDAATATFVAAPDVVCGACPSQVEAARSYWVVDVGVWCPTPARVVAVDRR